MKNIQQIKVIQDALVKKKDNILLEISRINTLIKGKQEAVNKMTKYLNEYQDDKKFNLSKSVPILNKNFDVFKDRINHLIFCEENEINNLETFREKKFDEVKQIEQKILLMDQFKTKVETELAYALEKNEQVTQDDMSSNKQVRDNND